MTSSNFSQEAHKLMINIVDQIEEQDLDFMIDYEYANEVLKIDVLDMIFVINKQTPLKEIWLASPLSGPYHFKAKDGNWIDKKEHELKKVLSFELSSLLNKTIRIK